MRLMVHLTTSCLVRNAKVRHSGNSSAGSNEAALRHCRCGSDLPRLRHGQQSDCLAVRVDSVDRRYVHAVLLAKLMDRIGKSLPEDNVDFREAGCGCAIVQDDIHYPLLDRLRKGYLIVF